MLLLSWICGPPPIAAFAHAYCDTSSLRVHFSWLCCPVCRNQLESMLNTSNSGNWTFSSGENEQAKILCIHPGGKCSITILAWTEFGWEHLRGCEMIASRIISFRPPSRKRTSHWPWLDHSLRPAEEMSSWDTVLIPVRSAKPLGSALDIWTAFRGTSTAV